MPRAKLPRPDQPLPPAPKRPWGAGSIDQRGNGYAARWRDSDGRQQTQQCATLAEAEACLMQVLIERNNSLMRALAGP